MTRQLGGSATTSTQFAGVAQPIAQVKGFVFSGTWNAADIITVSVYGRKFTNVTGSTVIDTFGATLVTALNAELAATSPQISQFTWSYTAATDTLTATSDTAGVECPITISTNSAAGLIDGAASSVGVNSTNSTGPNHIDNVTNWSLGVIPINDDEVVFADSNISALYGLDQSAKTPDLIRIDASYTGQGGLWRTNSIGVETATRYVTYTGSADLQVLVGDGPGSGTSFFMLDTKAGLASIDVQKTGTPIHDYAFIWKGTNASNTVGVAGGSMAIAMDAGELATVLTLRITVSNNGPRSRVFCGPGTTLTTILCAGDLHTESAATTVTIEAGGTWEHLNGAVSAVNLDGVLNLTSDGTITTCNVYGRGILDLSRSSLAVAIPTLKLWAGAQVIDPLGLISSFAPQLQGCSLADVRIIRPKSKTYTES